MPKRMIEPKFFNNDTICVTQIYLKKYICENGCIIQIVFKKMEYKEIAMLIQIYFLYGLLQ